MTIQESVWDSTDKTGMMLENWVKANNQLIRRIITESNAQTAMLYLIILSHRNAKSGQCFPSISLLAREMHLTDRNIQRMINTLCSLDVLIVNSGKQGVSNNYYFPKEDFFQGDVFTYKRKTSFRAKSQSKGSIIDEQEIAVDALGKDEDPEWDDFPF